MTEADGKGLIKEAMHKCYTDFIQRHKDVQKHFPKGEEKIDQILEGIEVKFFKAEITSGKSDGLNKD